VINIGHTMIVSSKSPVRNARHVDGTYVSTTATIQNPTFWEKPDLNPITNAESDSKNAIKVLIHIDQNATEEIHIKNGLRAKSNRRA